MKQIERVAIALGSNVGDRLAILKKAAETIAEEFLLHAQSSRVYETAPWGIVEQPPFLNAVIVGDSEWKPPAMLHYLKQLEIELGRKQRVRNGPRELDLDIICYGEKIWESPELSVPHPRAHEREFVLRPLADVWPDWRHPGQKTTAKGLLKALLETQPSVATDFAPPLLSGPEKP